MRTYPLHRRPYPYRTYPCTYIFANMFICFKTTHFCGASAKQNKCKSFCPSHTDLLYVQLYVLDLRLFWRINTAGCFLLGRDEQSGSGRFVQPVFLSRIQSVLQVPRTVALEGHDYNHILYYSPSAREMEQDLCFIQHQNSFRRIKHFYFISTTTPFINISISTYIFFYHSTFHTFDYFSI